MDQARIQADRNKFFLVGAIGTFMSTLDGSILNVALPSISEDLHADVHLVAWVVLAYTLTVVALMMVFGAWTERKGYLFAYRFAYWFFVIGSLACVLSRSIFPLIAARVVQGIGSAMFQAVGPGMIAAVFPANERGKGIGMMVMMVAAGLMAGPPIGGLLLQFFPWQSIFVINLPIGLVGIVLAGKYFRLLPKPDFDKPMHLAGGVAVALALSAFTFALSMLAEFPFHDWRFWLPAAVAIASFLGFLHFESRPDRHIIGLTLFRNRVLSAGLAAATAIFIAMSGVAILLPFYLGQIKGFEPSRIGLYLVTVPAIMFIVAPISGRLSDRIGFRLLTTVGMLIAAFGQYLAAQLDTATPNWFIILCLVTVGFGNSVFNTPNSSSILSSVAPSERARASSIIGTSRNIGTSVGIALGTALFAYFQTSLASEIPDPDRLFVAAFQRVAYIMMAVALLALPLCLARRDRPGPATAPARPADLGVVD